MPTPGCSRPTSCAHAGRWPEALPIYQELAARPEAPAAAQLGVAECLQALGQTAQAIEVLEISSRAHPATCRRARCASRACSSMRKKLPRAQKIVRGAHGAESRPTRNGRSMSRAASSSRSDQAAPALAIFEELLRDLTGVSESLLFGATLGSLEARAVLEWLRSRPIGVLENFISRYPESAYLEAAFRRLDEVYEQEEHPAENELKKWAQKPPARRAALAQYYLARMYKRVQKPEKAVDGARSLRADVSRPSAAAGGASDAGGLLSRKEQSARRGARARRGDAPREER